MANFSQWITPDAMNAALQEALDLGRLALRRKYGFGRSQNYVVVHRGHHFDSKALVAVAALLMHPPKILTSANSWGGESTTAVLDACHVKWINVDRLDMEIGPLAPADHKMDGSKRPRFWWANQGDNFDVAFEQGSLWASDFRADGQPAHEDWTVLQDMLPGDIVFHYAKKTLCAISQVVRAAASAFRPEGYGRATGYDDGWLVLIKPLVIDIEIGLTSLQKVLTPGVGPMNRQGTPGRTYVSPMPVGLGRKLADCLGVEGLWPSGSGSSKSEREHFRGYIPDLLHTDVEVTATRRAEQKYLRASLLAGGNIRCALCQRQLPPELLVAAHIKPRAECTPTERVDFRAAAMLACTLGCDALFEYGYVAVDADGVINTATPGHPDLDDVLERLRGTVCLAHSTATAANFQSHWASRFRGQRSAVVRKRRAPP